jgi:hypothetical protein
MPTNFLPWNPNQVNQESDATYSADTQRLGGAVDDQPFPSATANKLFYQTSTGVTALMQMMSAKGFTVNDTNISTLASVLAAIQTTADMRGALQTIAYSSSITCNAAQYLGFQVGLSGNVAITVTGAQPGDRIAFVFIQDSAGGHTVSWGGGGGFTMAPQPDPTPNYTSVIIFELRSDGVFAPAVPVISDAGIVNTNIGVHGPASGDFTGVTANSGNISNLTAATATLTSLTANSGNISNLTAAIAAFTTATSRTVGSGDNSNNVATTAWANAGSGQSFGTNGHFTFPTWLGGLTVQWGIAPDANGGQVYVPFPTAFSSACFIVVCTSVGVDRTIFTNGWSVSGFTYGNNGSSGGATWIAIGL